MSTVVEALKTLGLTGYEARAFDVVVGVGEATADVVAEAAAIPPTKVYSVLDTLETKGFVRSDDRRPRRYYAQRPGEVFAARRVALEKQLGEAQKVLEARYQERGRVFSGPFWLLKGADAVVERLRLLVPDASDTVYAALPFPLPAVDGPLVELLASAHRRGVRVRTMVSSTEDPLYAKLRTIGGEIRLGNFPIRPVLIDGRHGVVSFLVPQPSGELDLLAMWIPVPDLVGQIEPAIRRIFDQAPLAEQENRDED